MNTGEIRHKLRRIPAVAGDLVLSVVPLRPVDRRPVDPADPPYVPLIPKRPLGRVASGRGPAARAADRLQRQRFQSEAGSGEATTDQSTSLRRVDGALRLVTVRSGVNGQDVVRANLELVIRLCEDHDIDYFVVPETNTRRFRVGVTSSDWAAFVDALASASHDQPIYAGVAARRPTGPLRRWSEAAHHPEVLRAARTQREVEVFHMIAPQAEGRVFGRTFACLVERWDENELGALQAPGRNERSTYVSGSYRESVSWFSDGIQARTLSAFTDKAMFDVDFPIDLVYMWVDGSDPAWQLRKAAALQAAGYEVSPQGAAEERFRDNGELRYSLRSVEQFAPWVRTIYLVTDDQVPPWLNVGHPKLQVVDHKQIFEDRGTLPSFNSHAIAARLHHIEGLSEHYLIFNDDVLLGRLVRPSLFFQSNGVSKFFLSRSTLGFQGLGEAAPHEQARRNSADLLKRDFGRVPSQAFFHAPVPQRLSILRELEARYPSEFERTWNSQFRSPSDYQINSWLHHYYGYLTGATAPGRIRYDYFNPADPGAWRRMARVLRSRDLDAFCVNDSPEASAEQHAEIQAWLGSYFPYASTFELAQPA
jgi:hypothetical protein